MEIEKMTVDQIQSYLIEKSNYLVIEGYTKKWCEENLDVEFDTHEAWTEFAAYVSDTDIDYIIKSKAESYQEEKKAEIFKEQIALCERLDNEAYDTAFEEGKEAFNDGEEMSANPYENSNQYNGDDDYFRDAWIDGYEEAKEEDQIKINNTNEKRK